MPVFALHFHWYFEAVALIALKINVVLIITSGCESKYKEFIKIPCDFHIIEFAQLHTYFLPALAEHGVSLGTARNLKLSLYQSERHPVALVLCTGVDSLLLETRKLILERAGHKVIGARNLRQIEAACRKHHFDVAVLGQTLSSENKKSAASLVRKYCGQAKILELFQPHHGKTIADADAWLEVPAEVPQDLAERVTELAKTPPA